MITAYISIGSNIYPKDNILKAIQLLNEQVSITKISTFYKTKPLSSDNKINPNQADFINGMIEIKTDLEPMLLKTSILVKIENDLGRIRGEDKFAVRTIDLDLILYGRQIIENDDLSIPDKDILKRSFLYIPLMELNYQLIIPGTGKVISDFQFPETNMDMIPENSYTLFLKQSLEKVERQ